MGEIRVKSENLVESYVTGRYQSQFSGVLYAELDLKKDTTYTIALNLNNGYRVYINESIFTAYQEITGDDTVKILSVKTKSDLEKKANTYTDGKGWLLLKNAINESDYISVSDFQILEGTYTSETIPPYQPYFLNLPAHEKTADGWENIPTHTMTATGWQGELTSQSPLEFRATGQSLLDWRIDGASGGVGDWDETEQKYVIPVTVRGENLYSGVWEQGYWAYSDGTAGPGLTYVRTAKMLCEGNTKYEFVCSLPDGSKDYGFVFWGANGNFIGEAHSSDVQNTPVKYSATSPANARMMAVNIARYSDGERRPADILSFDLYELHETNLYTTSQLMDGDSLDYTTDQTSIPITQGDNTLTVDTAVQPSKVFVKFEG